MRNYTAFISSLAALAVVAVAPAAAADKKPMKDRGSIDVQYVKRDVQQIADGHVLLLSEASGANQGGELDGFTVIDRQSADLDKGNGPHRGYLTFSKGEHQITTRVTGVVSTTMKGNQPLVTMSGKWEIVGGIGVLAGRKGGGTFTGYYTAEDKYHIDWKGSSTGPQISAK